MTETGEVTPKDYAELSILYDKVFREIAELKEQIDNLESTLCDKSFSAVHEIQADAIEEMLVELSENFARSNLIRAIEEYAAQLRGK